MPEEKRGEYARKYPKRLNNVSIGTLIHIARDCGYTGAFTSTIPATKIERKPREIVKDEPEKIYDIVELVSSGPFNRIGDFRFVEKFSDVDAYGEPGMIDTYSSIYLHSVDIYNYYHSHKNDKGKNTLEGYHAACKAHTLHFDFDNKNPQIALEDTRKFVGRMCNKFNAVITSIQVWFSGSKGFSVFINDRAIAESYGAVDVPERIKKVCTWLAEDIGSFDNSVYNLTRIWRVPNTINSKTGLYKIPLTVNEIFSWNVDTIKDSAKNQRSI